MASTSAIERTSTESRYRTTAQLVKLLGLGRYWNGPLEQALLQHCVRRIGGGWPLDDVRAWKRQTMARVHQMRPEHWRAVALRALPVSLAQVEARAHVNATQATLDRWGLALVLAYTHDVLPMRPGRAGDRLRRQGFPPSTDIPTVLRTEVLRMWAAGASRADIRAACGVSPTVLSRALAGAPPRLKSTQVTGRFGWSPDNLNQKLRRSTFPAPDGLDGTLRWWWPSTVQQWQDEVALTTCPTCGAQVQRLRQHQLAHAN